MPLDPNALTQGLATGASLPNKNTGLSELIKTITKDLRTAKADRETKLMKLNETEEAKALKQQEMRMDLLGKAWSAGYTGDANSFLQTGDISTLQPKPQVDINSILLGNGQGNGMRPKGMTLNNKGEPTYQFETGFSEPEAGVMSKADFLVPELDKLINLVEKNKVYEGLGVPFGASRISSFGEKGPFQAFKRGLTGGKGREAGLLLQDIKVLAFGEGGKTLSENERATALSLIQPSYKTEEQWVSGLKQAKALLLRKAELMSGKSYGATSPYGEANQMLQNQTQLQQGQGSQFQVGQQIVKEGKTYTYVGNNQWSY